MRKNLACWIVVSLFCLVPAYAADAQPDGKTGLEAIFSTPKPTLLSSCTATSNCDGSTIVSCSGIAACVAEDTNCQVMQRGYVACDGVQTDCPVLCLDRCANYNRQWRGCDYTYSVQGDCCTSPYSYCPAVEICRF